MKCYLQNCGIISRFLDPFSLKIYFYFANFANLSHAYQHHDFIMSEKSKLQSFIFENLIAQYKKTADVVSALADLFDLHPNGVYKRIRGESDLTPDEIQMLAMEYKISLDAHIFKDSDSVLFQFNPFIKTIKNFDDYVNELYNAVKPLSELEGLTLHSASSELPLFYFLSSPTLFSFKMFVWARSVWNLENIRKEKFSFKLISPSTQEKAREIWEMYKAQDKVEMWSLNVLDSTLNQIEYYISINAFKNKTDALILCEALTDLVLNLETMVAQGKKMTGKKGAKNNFKLYHNEITSTNNTILIESETNKMVYCNFVSPDFLRTTDARIIEYTQNSFDIIISKSVLITSQGEKGRQYFFESLFAKIEYLKQRLKQRLNVSVN